MHQLQPPVAEAVHGIDHNRHLTAARPRPNRDRLAGDELLVAAAEEVHSILARAAEFDGDDHGASVARRPGQPVTR